MQHNFMWIWHYHDNAPWEGEYVPIAQVQAVKLAFAMLSHPRLGCTATGKILGYDTIKLVLTKFSEPID